ncbi:FG-GAP repeat domain-containing protein [Aestuariicoccus sp. MJ-SS9]|uniref:FG-GAP repeat domain-containing protein n=1 Tax=Aestuariicoccus sp. MJ-SS9 TaxID=3079855 RepID=UPI003977ACA7
MCLWLASLALASSAGAEIVSARYGEPTTRYAHGVLGDAVEWGALELVLSGGQKLRAVLPERLVFEDIAPRLADLDGDGAPEVIVVESSLTEGARLAVWDETGRIAATAHIGQRNRWLAPAGAGDLDGDGRVEIAYVDRPHLAKVLRVLRVVPDDPIRLEPVAELAGLSNHRIGWDYILGGLRDCGAGAELVLADGGWSRILAVRLDAGTLQAREIGADPSRSRIGDALRCGF